MKIIKLKKTKKADASKSDQAIKKLIAELNKIERMANNCNKFINEAYRYEDYEQFGEQELEDLNQMVETINSAF